MMPKYIVRAANSPVWVRFANLASARDYARKSAELYGGASVYVSDGDHIGDVVASWDADGKRVGHA